MNAKFDPARVGSPVEQAGASHTKNLQIKIILFFFRIPYIVLDFLTEIRS